MEEIKYYDKNKLFELSDNEKYFLKRLGILSRSDGTFERNGVIGSLKYSGISLERNSLFHSRPLVCYTYKRGNDEVNLLRPTDYNDFGCREYVIVKIDGVEYSYASGIHLEYSGPSESYMRPDHHNDEMISNNIKWCCMRVAKGKDYVYVYSRPDIVYGDFLRLGVIVNKDDVKNRDEVFCRLSGITRRKNERYNGAEKYEFDETKCYDLLCDSVNDLCRDMPDVKDFFNNVDPLLIDSIKSSLKIPLFIYDYRKMNRESRQPIYGANREYLDEELRVLDLLEERYVKSGEFVNGEGGIRR